MGGELGRLPFPYQFHPAAALVYPEVPASHGALEVRPVDDLQPFVRPTREADLLRAPDPAGLDPFELSDPLRLLDLDLAQFRHASIPRAGQDLCAIYVLRLSDECLDSSATRRARVDGNRHGDSDSAGVESSIRDMAYGRPVKRSSRAWKKRGQMRWKWRKKRKIRTTNV